MDWKKELNDAANSWSCKFPGDSEKAALEGVCKVVREINANFGCQLIEPTHEHMALINKEIGDIEESTSIDDLVELWNALADPEWVKPKQQRQPVKALNDIYPLTIVRRRFGGFAIINADCFADCVEDLQSNEEWHYGDSAHIKMEQDYPYIVYGVGESIDEALVNYAENEIKVKAWEEAARNRVLTDEEKKRVEELARKMSKTMPPIGMEPMDITPMDGPSGVIYYLDSLYKDKKNER